jgi:predicted Zn finger-like uncharacterized protein
MNIECPSCHLTGKINELDLPPDGKDLNCPRCKKSFHVAKPADAELKRVMMNSCPACQYSTFTDEMFTVCPKCGMTLEEFQKKAQRRQEKEPSQRDLQQLNRSIRNPDLIKPPIEEKAPEAIKAAQPVAVTAWSCIGVALAILCYGIYGLLRYYGKDWQAALSETLIEPVSKTHVFFTMGFVPWVMSLFGIYFTWTGYQFLNLKSDSHKRLVESAWGGFAVVVIYEAMDFIKWIRVSSSDPSLSYYAAGIFSSIITIALMGVPFFLLLWYLNSDTITREVKNAQFLSAKR